MSHRDLITRLRQADPAPRTHIEGWNHTEEGRRIRDRVVSASPAPEARPPARRRGIRILVVGAMLVAGIAAVYVTSRPTTDPLSVGCYRTLDQNADIAILPLAGSEVKPAERCAAEWRSAFGVDVPPELITCVVRDGGLGIFPGKEGLDAETTCAAIGASTPRSGTYGGKTASEVRAWAGDVESAYIQASKKRDDCLSEAVLAALIRESFDRWDFETWTVSRVESDGDLRCASYSVDSVNAVVILVEDH